jgi:hypothetical protein
MQRPTFFSNLCGLCGNFNGVASDDLLPRFAMNLTLEPSVFVQSWKSDECQPSGQTKMDNFDDVKTDQQKPAKTSKSK